MLGSEVGGRFNGDAHGLLRDLVRVRACRAPPALRAAAASGWTRHDTTMVEHTLRRRTASGHEHSSPAGRGRYRRMQPARQARPSTASSTWQRPRGRAACHCAGRRSRRCARPSFRRKRSRSRSRWSSVVSPCSRYWRGKKVAVVVAKILVVVLAMVILAVASVAVVVVSSC